MDDRHDMTITWKSDKTNLKKEFKDSLNTFELIKWGFLLETAELTKKIQHRIKEKSTEISQRKSKSGIRLKFLCRTSFKNDVEFDQWRSECFKSAEEVLSDLHFVFFECGLEDAEFIRNAFSRKSWSTVKIVEEQISNGVLFLGDGSSLTTVILEIREGGHFKYTNLIDPEIKQEINIGSIELDALQTRCLNHLDLEKRLNEKFPLVKTYSDSCGKILKLFGNEDDVKQEEEFLRNNKWLAVYFQKEKKFAKEVIDFLCQDAVLNYLETEVQRKGMGTWGLYGAERCVIAYGDDDKKAEEVLTTLCQSFNISRFKFSEKGKQREKFLKLQERAKEYKKKTNGKFCMCICQIFDKGETEILFLYTNDLLNDRDLDDLLDEKQSLVKSIDLVEDKVDVNPFEFFIMKEMKQNGYLGLREDVDVKFGEGNSLILRGERLSVSAEKTYIEGLKLVKRSMILPQSLTMLQKPEEVCLEHRCLLQRTPSAQESQVWFMNNCVVIVYHGEPKKDLSVDLKANVILSDGDIQGKNNYSCFLLLIMH